LHHCHLSQALHNSYIFLAQTPAIVIWSLTPPRPLLSTPTRSDHPLQDVLPRRGKILGVPLPLLQAQRRHVRGIRDAGPPDTGEDGPRWVRMRQTRGAFATAGLLLAALLRLRIRDGEPRLAHALIAQASQMKRAVFDNGLLMAIATPRALRIRALAHLPLLVPGKDFFGAALAAHPLARRPRPTNTCLCALKSASSSSPLRSSFTANTPYLISRHTNIRWNETHTRCYDPHKVIEGTKKGYPRVEPTRIYMSARNHSALHSGF
jgi:hypothetical protein